MAAFVTTHKLYRTVPAGNLFKAVCEWRAANFLWQKTDIIPAVPAVSLPEGKTAIYTVLDALSMYPVASLSGRATELVYVVRYIILLSNMPSVVDVFSEQESFMMMKFETTERRENCPGQMAICVGAFRFLIL